MPKTSPDTANQPVEIAPGGATNTSAAPLRDTSARDLAIGGAVLLVLLVIYFFVRNAYVHHLVVKRVAPSTAGSAGWLMFVGAGLPVLRRGAGDHQRRQIPDAGHYRAAGRDRRDRPGGRPGHRPPLSAPDTSKEQHGRFSRSLGARYDRRSRSNRSQSRPAPDPVHRRRRHRHGSHDADPPPHPVGRVEPPAPDARRIDRRLPGRALPALRPGQPAPSSTKASRSAPTRGTSWSS